MLWYAINLYRSQAVETEGGMRPNANKCCLAEFPLFKTMKAKFVATTCGVIAVSAQTSFAFGTGGAAQWPACTQNDVSAKYGAWSAEIEPLEGALLWSGADGPVGIYVELETINALEETEAADAIAMDIIVNDAEWAAAFKSNPRLRVTLEVGSPAALQEKTEGLRDFEALSRAYNHYVDYAYETQPKTGQVGGTDVVLQSLSFDREYTGQVPISDYLRLLSYADDLFAVAALMPETAGGQVTYPAHYAVSTDGLSDVLAWLDDSIGVICRNE